MAKIKLSDTHTLVEHNGQYILEETQNGVTKIEDKGTYTQCFKLAKRLRKGMTQLNASS